MLICKVVKPLVSTNRIPGFEYKHLQVVLDGSTQKVAVDAVGCVPGDWVICVGSSAAREAAGSKSYPSDLTIVGISHRSAAARTRANDRRQWRERCGRGYRGCRLRGPS